MPVTETEFKQALGLWPSGVTVVTSGFSGEIMGMTVSSFASVSLQPPLVSVCLLRSTRTLQLLRRSLEFGVNILSEGQSETSSNFASGEIEERFENQSYTLAGECPLLDGALVQLQCSVVALHDAGDHRLVVGQVEALRTREGQPLVYWQGRYGGFAAE